MKITDKTIQVIYLIASSFAAATTLLFFALVLLEYFRRGFVANFFDLRYLAALVVVFTAASALTAREIQSRRLEKIFIAIAIIFAAYVIIDMSLPFGRLGLVVIGCGILTLVALFFSVTKKLNPNP